MSDARERLQSAAQTVSVAVNLLKVERKTLDKFLAESRDMESFGAIVDPTLYRDPERKAVSALMVPLFQAAVDFIKAYDTQVARAKAAPEKVQG